MPITATSPKHSFVNLNGLLSDIVLPAYNGIDIAFQFMFSADSFVSLSAPVKAGVAYTSGGIINATFDVTSVCAWGVFEEIDLNNDFPITITTFPLRGTYATKQDLLLAVQAAFNINATDQTFMQCCSLDALPEILFSYTNAVFAARSAGVNFYKALQFVNIAAGFDTINVQPDQCFRYVVSVSGQNFLSNVFKRVMSDRFITQVTYSNNEDAYGFNYRIREAFVETTVSIPRFDENNVFLGFFCSEGWTLSEDGHHCIRNIEAVSVVNKLYLPILTKKPIFPETRKVYIKSNKQYKVLSAVIEKEWECKTEDLPDEMHEKIAVMLAHDNINFSNGKISADVFKKDDYAIAWDDSDTVETSIATFKVNTVFEGRNSNCEKRSVCTPAVQPVECIAVTIDNYYEFPGASVNQALSASQEIKGGTEPYTLTVITKPSWLNIAIIDNHIVYSGTPLNSALNQSIQISVSNCGGTVSYSTTTNVTAQNTGDGTVMFGDVTIVSGDVNSETESIQIIGGSNAVVTITLTTYTNTNGGQLLANGSIIYLNQTFTVNLDANGQGSFTATINGNSNNSSTIIRGIFTITAVSSGTIGNNNTHQISKAF